MEQRHKGGLSTWNLVMLALGSVVGGSFFLGTAVTLKAAGPGALLAFAIGGGLVYLILTALSELTISRPTDGSFRAYAEVAFGPMASFVVGWVYWIGLVLAMSSEATAAALFARLWLPGVPVWLLSLAVVVGVTLLNLLNVRLFSMIESVMSAVKLLAIAGFILLMAVVIFGLWPGRPPIGLGAVRSEPLLPGGLGGLAGAMLIVFFSYAGFEVLGLAAPDAKDPQRTVPRAITLTMVAMAGLFILGIAALLPVLPIGAASTDVSPLVAAVRLAGFVGLSGALNLIVMSASLSTMLAAIYGLGRMLYSLAEEGAAPALFARLTPAGAPRNALFASAGGMLVGVVLAFVLPKQAYLLLASSGAFSLLFAYLAILASQLVIRRKEGCRPNSCKMPFYPYGTWVGIAGVVGAMAAMPLVPGQGVGLIAGIALVLVTSAAYFLTRRRAPAGAGPEPETGAERAGEDDLLKL
jgi:L-asparagine transporter-like permease